MRYTLTVTPAAEDDVAEAKDWYDGQRAGLGTDFVVAVREAVARVRRQPMVHAPLFLDIRRAFVNRFPYLVFYRVVGRHVSVIAVHHGSRDPSGWQSRV